MADFWASAIGLSLLLYVVLDGFDLGIGILFPFASDERGRQRMMDAVSPVWDGNETWLVITGGALFGTFPAAYALLLSAFYLPLIVMLCGLILRGVAFEFRGHANSRKWLWSTSFFLGSLLATFAQGTAVGAFVQQLPVKDGLYAGGLFTWLSPFSLLCGFGLVCGYAMLGAGWLIHKTDHQSRDFGYAVLPWVMGGVVAFLLVAAVSVFALHLEVAQRWFQRPVLFVFPIVGAAALAAMILGIVRKYDRLLYPSAVTMFVMAFLTMVLSLLPYIVPFSLTIADAAAPHASLAFLFWGAGIIVLPITLIYTGAVYFIFRGKIATSS